METQTRSPATSATEFFRFLAQESSAPGWRLIAIAGLAGAANGGLIAIILHSANETKDGPAPLRFLVAFLAAFALFLLTRKHIMDRTATEVEAVVRKVRVRIADKLRRAELAEFERISQPTIQSVLGQNSYVMSEAARQIIGGLSSGVLLVCALAYIATLSMAGFWLIGAMIAAAVVAFLLESRRVERELSAAMREEDSFFGVVRHLLDGFPELKINEKKAQDLFEGDIRRLAEHVEKLKAKTAKAVNWLVLFGQSFFYVLIGMVLFVLPNLVGDNDLPAAKIISITIFIIGPIGELVGALPAITKANVATRALKGLEATLEGLGGAVRPAQAAGAAPFESLKASGLTFRYPGINGAQGFQVGPLDLEVRRGEVVFLVGGNGTGKSTLLRLLTGLYAPAEGALAVNGAPISASRLPELRSRYAVILQPFHLFHRLLGHPEVPHGRVEGLLAMLRLDKVTGVDASGRFLSTNLSTGQKKRLALLCAELDDREIFVLDEWAADQDPEFRRWFYTEFLAELTRRGKTVIAATHDDHYFGAANRVLKMSDGKLVPFDTASLAPAREARPA